MSEKPKRLRSQEVLPASERTRRFDFRILTSLFMAFLMVLGVSSSLVPLADAGTQVSSSNGLKLQVTATPNPAKAGDSVLLTFTIQNDSPHHAYMGTVGKLTVSPTCTVSTPSEATGWVQGGSNGWRVDPGKSATLSCTMVAKVGETTVSATLSNMYHFLDGKQVFYQASETDSTRAITASEIITVGGPGSAVTSSDGFLTVTKSASTYSLPAGGGQVTYTYTLKNNSSSYRIYEKVNGVSQGSYADDKCSAMRYGTGWSTDTYNNRWIPAGETATLTCTQNLTATTTNSFTIRDLYVYYGSGYSAYFTGSVTAKATVVVQQKPDLTVTKTADRSSAKVGDTVTYTINVKNTGGAASSTWSLTDAVPSNFTTVATNTAGCAVSGNTVTCANQPALAAGATKSIVVTAKAATAGSTSNTATVTSTGESSTTNNSGTAAVSIVEAKADLGVTLTASPSTVMPGNTVNYEMTVTNGGNISSSPYGVTVTFPSSLTNVQFSGAEPEGCTIAGNTLTCTDQAALAAAATKKYTFTATVETGTTATTSAVTAKVTSTGDTNTANDSATASTGHTGPDLAVTKTATPNPLSTSTTTTKNQVTYTITVENKGSATSGTYTLTDVVPTFFGAPTTPTVSPATTACTISGNTLTCANQTGLAPGAKRTYTFKASEKGLTGTFTNTATVTSAGDVNPANDSGSVAVKVQSSTSAAATPGSSGGPVKSNTPAGSYSANFTLEKTANKYLLPTGGGEVTYTYKITNNNPYSYRDSEGYSSGWYYSLFYKGVSDDKCANVRYVSGMQTASTGEQAIRPGGTATFTCTTTVTQTTTNKATATFYTYWGSQYTTTYDAKATATATVNVDPGAGISASCNTLWYGSDNTTTTTRGTLGTVSGSAADETKRTDVWPASTTNTGTAAVAVDPRNPNLVYYVPRDYPGSAGYGGLRVYDSASKQDLAVASGADTPDVVRLGFDPNGLLWALDSTGTLYAWSDTSGWSSKGTLTGTATFRSGASTALKSLDSGDLAFDGLGNLWFIGSTQNGDAGLFTVSQSSLLSGSPEATYVGQMNQAGYTYWFHGLAFDESGTLYASADRNSTTYLYRVNMESGSASEIGPITYFTSDLASCALPKPELRVTKTASLVSSDGTSADAPGAKIGDVLRFRIVAENIGNLATTGTYLQDNLPSNTTYVPDSTKLNGKPVADINGTMPYVTDQLINSTSKAADGTRVPDKAGVVGKYDPNDPLANKAIVEFDVEVLTGAVDESGQVCNQALIAFVGADETGIKSDDPSRPGAEDPTCKPVYSPEIGVDKKAADAPDNPEPGVIQTGEVLPSMTGFVGRSTPLTGEGESIRYYYTISVDPNQPKDGPPETPTTGLRVGNEPLKDVTITDDKCASVSPVLQEGSTTLNRGDRNSDGFLDPAESWWYTCDALNLKEGVTNTVTVNGVGKFSQLPVDDKDTWTLRSFSIEKLAKNDADSTGWTPTGAEITVAADGTLTAIYRVNVSNTAEVAAKHPEITDTLTLPTGFSIAGVTVKDAADSAVSATLSGNKFTIPAGTTELKPDASTFYTIEVKLKADMATADWANAGVCNTKGRGDRTKGLFNQIAGSSDSDGPDNNDACVPVKSPAVDITILKQGVNCDTDSATCALPGAAFALYDVDPSTAGAEALTPGVTQQVDEAGNAQDNGYFDAKGLLPGKDYWLVETKAPDKFNLLATPVKFQVTSNNGIALADPAAYGDSATVNTSANKFQLIIKDTTPTPLPAAGGRGMFPYIGVGIALIIGAGLAYTTNSSGLRRKPKRAQA